jgi:pimeloyl-ACP methyl ester carboxylesterase
MNPNRVDDTVSIGLICQANGAGDAVITLRGTEGTMEWIHDAEFLTVPCPFLVGAGHTEDGFTAMYNSLRTGTAPNSPTVAKSIGSLQFPRPVTSMTVCGHSLGGALATLLALDLAANTVFSHPVVYTYGSPRTGDALFVSTFNQVVTNSYRIENRLDIVPKLPPTPAYQHVDAAYELTPVRLLPLPAEILVDFTPTCEHAVATYLHLLSLRSGGTVIPLDVNCQPQSNELRLGRSVSGDRCRAVTATTAVSGGRSAERTGIVPMDRLVVRIRPGQLLTGLATSLSPRRN